MSEPFLAGVVYGNEDRVVRIPARDQDVLQSEKRQIMQATVEEDLRKKLDNAKDDERVLR